jgi:hypothetical protein
MLARFRLRSIVGTILLVAGVAFVLSIGIAWGRNAKGPQGVLDFLRDPVVLTVLGAIFTFLAIDRWRRLEGEVSEIHKTQTGVFSDIREDAKTLVRDGVEEAARKAQALDDRISSLLDDHPWIADITENEFIPDASTCSIVLATSKDLWAKKRASLVYEYLFGWVKRPPNKQGLEGTAADFFSLADFCEWVVGDEYLSFLVLREGTQRSIGSSLLLPRYLRDIVHLGRLEEARTIAEKLQVAVFPKWYQKLWRGARLKPTYMKADFRFEAANALAIYASAVGRGEDSERYLVTVRELAKNLRGEKEEGMGAAEIALVHGDYADARKILDGLGASKSDGRLGQRVAKLQAALEKYGEGTRFVASVGPSAPPVTTKSNEREEKTVPFDEEARKENSDATMSNPTRQEEIRRELDVTRELGGNGGRNL